MKHLGPAYWWVVGSQSCSRLGSAKLLCSSNPRLATIDKTAGPASKTSHLRHFLVVAMASPETLTKKSSVEGGHQY